MNFVRWATPPKVNVETIAKPYFRHSDPECNEGEESIVSSRFFGLRPQNDSFLGLLQRSHVHVFSAVIAAMSFVVLIFSVSYAMTIDGNFSDWDGIAVAGTDNAGDVSTGDTVDWDSVWILSADGILYLSYQTVSDIDFVFNAWRYAVYIDTDNDAVTGFKGFDGSYRIGAEYLIEGGVLHRYTGSGTNWSWAAVSSLSYGISGERIEIGIPEGDIGLSGNYSLRIMLLGNNPVSIDYAKDDKSGFAYLKQNETASNIDSSSDYLWYFGDWNTANGVNEVEEAKNFRFVLVHPTNSDITPENITEAKKGKDGILGTDDDILFIGYISVGEDIRTDNIHNMPPASGDGTGPVYYDSETQEIVYQNNGYASYYLDDVDKNGVPDRNWQYNGCYVNPGNPEYQNLLKASTMAQNGFVGIDEIFNVYGCDGIMLDTIDIANPIGWGFPFYFEWTASGLHDFIQRLRQWYPDKMIILNRGLVYYDPNQKQQNGDRYLEKWNPAQYVDMVMFEGYYWPGDEGRNRYYWAPRVNAEADRPNGFTVIGLDYVGDAEIAIDGGFDDWTVYGVERQGVEKLGNALIWSKGVYTPDELADDVGISGIDMTDIWAANEAANDNLYLKVKFKGAVDFADYNYYIFLDTDRNKVTGYQKAAGSATGADYMIFDGDNQYLHLYKYVGIDNTSWSWQWICFIPFAIGDDGAAGNSMELKVLKSDIGESDAFNEAVDVTFLAEKTDGDYAADFAPNDITTDYYEYLFRVKSIAISEAIKEQGWLEYVIPLSDGGKFQPIDYTVYNNHPPVDSAPPVWDSTAASAGVKPPSIPVSRIGIQEAEPGNGCVTVRWDVARDQTRPVNYNIYYSDTSPINFNAAIKLIHVDKGTAGRNYYNGTGLRKDFPGCASADGFYSERTGEGVYPYEYTVTGLTNGQAYYFAVRAEDSFAIPHEDTNTVELSATPYGTAMFDIEIDGNFADWQNVRQIDFSPGETENESGFPSELDITDIWVGNDKDYLFFKVRCKSAIEVASSDYDIFLDVDGDNDTGYAGGHNPPYPWAIGADYLIQDGILYKHSPVNGYRIWNWDQARTLNFHVGDDNAAQNAFEVAVPRSLIDSTNVESIKLLFMSDRVLATGEHVSDYAPNDAFSHAYTYFMCTERIVIDGGFDDWNGVTPIGTDAVGDISGGDVVDWTALWAANNAGILYLSYQTVSNIDFASNAWRYAVYIDTDNSAVTGFKGFDGSYQIGAEYLIEGGVLHRYTGSGTNWSWVVVSSLSYDISGERIEMGIPEEALGLSGNYIIRIMLLGNNTASIDYAKDDKSGFVYP